MENLFEKCRKIADDLNSGNEIIAREEVILLLDELTKCSETPNELVNHLIRETGLYPYIDDRNSLLGDALVKDLFSVSVGGGKTATFHRDQSVLLKSLLTGESLVVSAPTSFGKSFVIDALISLKHPSNVMIIVPTIALADETRRRIYKKFSREYKVITTADVQLGQTNILIFPQERAINYSKVIQHLDLLVIDEFYKADPQYEPERSLSLIKLITQMQAKSAQCYFLAPNIDDISQNPFTKGMKLMRFEQHTVVLRHFKEYKKIANDPDNKIARLKELLSTLRGHKTLIYVNGYSQLDIVLKESSDVKSVVDTGSLLHEFAEWVDKNYIEGSSLAEGARHGIVQHNGRIHRSLAQIIVKLFEDAADCDVMIATSSLIEGVNTSAENIILWRRKKSNRNLDSFTYKNIIGRGGRMFRHFVGNIYEMEQPPDIYKQEILDLGIPNEELQTFNDENSRPYLTADQIAAIKAQKDDLAATFGADFYKKVFVDYSPSFLNTSAVKSIANDLRKSALEIGRFRFLLDDDTNKWDAPLQSLLLLMEGEYNKREERQKLLKVIKVLPNNWIYPLNQLLKVLACEDITLDAFFKYERDITYKVSSLIQDFNVIQRSLYGDELDLSPFVSRLSCAFLPPRVYDLEECGLPRMISWKIQKSGVLNLEQDIPLENLLEQFRTKGASVLKNYIQKIDRFDEYIIDYFYEGISN